MRAHEREFVPAYKLQEVKGAPSPNYKRKPASTIRRTP